VTDPFAGLEPAPFWRHFEALTRIPRPTYEEGPAAAHVVAWASGRGFETRRDGAGNLVVDVPATPGRETAPTVILQGHLDIVCERDPDSPYDPREGRIHVVRDGEWLRADGTTLGADNGVAIAAMLACVEDPEAPHGPLELLMTVAEEVGLAGAAALAPELITGDVLINLDGEDATFTVGCAGGVDSILRLDAPRAPVGPDDVALRVTVAGGRGGHSGGDIAAGRSNAIKLLVRALSLPPELQIASFDGGASRNAIPRDAAAVVVVPAAEAGLARDLIVTAGVHAASAYEQTDPGVRVRVAAPAAGAPPGVEDHLVDDAVEAPADAWTTAASARILALVAALPSGPLGISADFPGVVETSSSLGIALTENGRLMLHCLSRSANDHLMPEVTAAIAGAARLAGAEVELGREYPGWRPDLASPVLATARAVHERLFGAPPHVTLTHGGLEPAIIGRRKPGLDMLSFGPRIEGNHAPGERLHVGSAERFTRLLAALLDELSRGQLQG
jgi:dipeptidase D